MTPQSLWKVHRDFPQHSKKIPQSSQKNTLQVLKHILRITISGLRSEQEQVPKLRTMSSCWLFSPPSFGGSRYQWELLTLICCKPLLPHFRLNTIQGTQLQTSLVSRLLLLKCSLNFVTLLSRKRSRKVFKHSKTFPRSCMKNRMANGIS